MCGEAERDRDRPDLERLVRAREAGIEALIRDIRHLPAEREKAVLASAFEPSFRTHAPSYATWSWAPTLRWRPGQARPKPSGGHDAARSP